MDHIELIKATYKYTYSGYLFVCSFLPLQFAFSFSNNFYLSYSLGIQCERQSKNFIVQEKPTFSLST